MLIYKRLVRWMLGKKERRHPAHLNSATSPYLWALTGLSVAPALLFWQNTAILVACSIAFVFIYITLYRMLILFKIPAWVKARQRRYKE